MTRKMQTHETTNPEQKKRCNEAILIAVIASLVTGIGAGLTFYSSYLTTRQASAQSCIQRLDQQEVRIREKAAIFLGNLSDQFGRGADASVKNDEMISLSVKTMRSALEFSAYAPTEMGISAIKVASAIRDTLIVDSNEEIIAAVDKLNTTAQEWPKQYYQLMDDFQRSRLDCQK
ncbi:hypothetical protein I1A_002801 [Pseudomonas fluorescens R124]|uniref:Uncharacterized protein n=2 Tax=Pseudomonas fluorescens TaxID=294 RepID=A0A7U9CN63_PSEFL|nr:hypothetical protein I1A_002801 [Pseudomonas fluorescens R124]